jgi:hypothetical protein
MSSNICVLVVILPATVRHLHLEFSLNQVPHEIMVVDNGSSDKTWVVLIREFFRNEFYLRPW